MPSDNFATGLTSHVLILTQEAGTLSILKDILEHAHGFTFILRHETHLVAGIDKLTHPGIDAIITDFLLADSEGISTFEKLFAAAPHIPIVTLGHSDDDDLAVDSVGRGAQGYFVKSQMRNSLLPLALRNIIQRKGVEEAFYKETTRAEIALNSISDAVMCTNVAGLVDYLNIAAEKLTGWSREAANGHAISEVFKIINGSTRLPELNTVELVLQQNRVFGLPANTVLIKHDGTEAAIEDSAAPIHDWNGKLAGAVIVFHDVTAEQAMVVKMAHLAQHDFLTNLPNRVLLNDRIDQAINLAKRRRSQVALLFLDLDNFKHINDSLGHETGDKLLQSLAQRLVACVRSSDTVSRLGGDEFIILLAGDTNEETVARIAHKIMESVSLPHEIESAELHITTSIGISLYPQDGHNAEAMIKNSDTAMYHAKQSGRNNIQFFHRDMNTRAVERQYIESCLRGAIARKEFILHYQPKINLETGTITGVEALLRWQHPEWGLVLPERFITIAEDCGLIVPIGQWVLREACSQFVNWLSTEIDPISLAVNISAVEFRHMNFFDSVRTILEDTGLEPKRLQLEITESVLMRDGESSTMILQELKDMGIQLAIDDFGTGYSSLSYLKRFPIDVLKIDQSFVRDIGSVNDDGVIVSAVIGMGNNLKLRVVAEGIESQKQLSFLREQRCEEGQGFLFSLPLGATQLASLISSGTGLLAAA